MQDENEHAILADGLALLMRKQLPFLVDLGHNNIEPDTLARYSAALLIEVAEMANALPWKVWKRPEELTPEAVRSRVLEEWADCLHFVGTFQALLWHLDINPEQAASAFERKHAENQERRALLVASRRSPNGREGLT